VFDAEGQARSMTGQQWAISHYVNITQTMGYDGDGEKGAGNIERPTTYYLKSSVLDGGKSSKS